MSQPEHYSNLRKYPMPEKIFMQMNNFCLKYKKKEYKQSTNKGGGLQTILHQVLNSSNVSCFRIHIRVQLFAQSRITYSTLKNMECY